MSHDKNEVSLYHGDNLGIFPRSFFPSLFGDSFWDNFGFGFGGLKVDVREKSDSYVIDAEMPGIDKNNVSIDIYGNVLTITANVNENSEQKDEDGRYLRRERRMGSYRRSFTLDNIKSDEIKAEMNNGILTIVCPKKSENAPNYKRIPIQ